MRRRGVRRAVFLGHFGLAMGANRWAGGVPLGVLVFASQWPDLLWPVLVLAGVERVVVEPGVTTVTPLDFVHYPWSHSLLMVLVWGAAIGGTYYAWRRRGREALLVGALVPSHWLLDLLAHRPDLPLWPGGPTVGLGLWNSLPATLLVEFDLFAVGAWLFLATTEARDRIGSWGAYGLVLLLVVIYAGNAFGPAPPNVTVVAVAGLSLSLVVALAWWIDGHRTTR